jgi:hypothetical protein
MSDADKLAHLIASEGCHSLNEFLQDYGNEPIVPGICMTDHCNYTTGVAPGETQGYCPRCGTNTVKSGLVLAGVI